MKAIIMAGGEGTRLRPLTCDCPKPMIRLMNRPVMQYALALLKKHGVSFQTAMNSLELSRHEGQLRRKRKPTSRKTETLVRYEFDPNNPPPLTSEQIAELQALAAMPDSAIDTSDIPEMDEERMRSAIKVRNPWADPPTKTKIKEFLVDSDIIYWILKQVGDGRQEKMNAMLRRAMREEREEQKAG